MDRSVEVLQRLEQDNGLISQSRIGGRGRFPQNGLAEGLAKSGWSASSI